MGNILSAFLLLVAFLLLGFFIWMLYTFVRSGFGKYPPSISSFGQMNKVMIRLADEILSSSAEPLEIIDMGSGTGKVLRELAKKYPMHHFTGYEWDFFVYRAAKLLCSGYKNITLYRRNFMNADLSDKDLIIAFCGNEIAPEISDKILREAKPNVKIISEAFRIPNLPNEMEYEAKTWKVMPIKVFTYSLS